MLDCAVSTTLAAVEAPVGERRRGLIAPRHGLALILLFVLPAMAQSPGMPPGAQAPGGERVRTAGAVDSDSGGADGKLEAKRITALNVARQKSMVSDANKLLQLARELQDDADAGETKLSAAERFRKAAEIEKLAKDVKAKMVFAIGGPDPFVAGPFTIWQH